MLNPILPEVSTTTLVALFVSSYKTKESDSPPCIPSAKFCASLINRVCTTLLELVSLKVNLEAGFATLPIPTLPPFGLSVIGYPLLYGAP